MMHKFTLDDIKKALDFVKSNVETAEISVSEDHVQNTDEQVKWQQNVQENTNEIFNKEMTMEILKSMAADYFYHGQYQAAIQGFNYVLEIAEEINDKERMATAFNYLGIAYERIGQYQKATDHHRKLLNVAGEIADVETVGVAVFNEGTVYNKTCQYHKAVDCYENYLAIAKMMDDREGVAKAYGNMGVACRCIGQYQEAMECFRNALEISQEIGNREGAARAIGNLGIMHYCIGEYKKAMNYYRKCLEIAEKIGKKEIKGEAFANMGNAFNALGDHQKAIDHHRTSLDIASEMGDKAGVGKQFGNMGITYYKIGQYQQAMDCHRKRLEISEEIGDRQGKGATLGNIGNVYFCMGQNQNAIDSHLKQLEIAEEIGDIAGVAKAQMTLGMCYELNDLCLACSFFAKSILSFESVRDSLTSHDEYNISMANNVVDAHKSLVKGLLNLKQVKAALLVSDSGKSKALSDLTRASVHAVFKDTTPNSTFQVISDDPYSKTTELLLDKTLAKLNDLMEDNCIVSYTFDRHGNLHAWVVSKKGVFHKRWQPTNGLSAKTYLKTVNARLSESLFQDLPRDAIFIPHYQTLEKVEVDQSAKLALTGQEGNKANNFISDLKKKIENLTRVNNASLARIIMTHEQESLQLNSIKRKYNLDFIEKTSDQIHKIEKKCLERYSLDKPNVCCCPERISDTNQTSNIAEDKDEAFVNYLRKQYSIFILPIEEYLTGSKILIVPEGILFKAPFCAFLNSKNEHLCDNYNLQFTPALHVLNAALLKSLPKLGAALFVGNPNVGVVKFGDKPQPIPPLPNAAIEASKCGKYFSTEPLLEKNATKENVLKNMKAASIIHIAAHGHMDHADIFLAPNEGAPNPPTEEHYLLTSKDVLDCTLKARLVVLSCCYSGRGQISAEGVVGIARSFLGAGARSVLVTLWRIPDKETMEFMKLFYERVCKSLSVCVALQLAMIELKKKYTMPAWAPFQIVGEDIALTQKEIEEIRRQSSLR